MTRSQLREEIFKGLFLSEFHQGDDLTEQMQLFLDQEQTRLPDEEDDSPVMPTSDAQYAEDKIKDILANQKDIDARIDQVSDHWTTERMNKVDLALLRLATYEMIYEGIDVGIAINEAVELAKSYGEEKSYKFVNGVLGKIAKVQWD